MTKAEADEKREKEMNKNKIIQCALEAGIMISTYYGQGVNKHMPVSDHATLEKFAELLLEEIKDENGFLHSSYNIHENTIDRLEKQVEKLSSAKRRNEI